MRYNGGKNSPGVYQWIINHIPPHTRYIELFAGSGAILRHIRPARSAIAIDLDERSTRYLQSLSIAGLVVLREEVLSWLKHYTPLPGDFIYADPPYPRSTRIDARRMYRYELGNLDHIALLRCLKDLTVPVAISTYTNPIYTDELGGWRLSTITTHVRDHSPRTECLYMNYPPPTCLHDYSYLGHDFRERERIRRKYKRWEHRLRLLPEMERAMLQTLLTGPYRQT